MDDKSIDNKSIDNKAENSLVEISEYRRKDNLIRRKLLEYVPVLIATNLSMLLINTVDKVVAGNYVGADAMNSISIFYPVLLITASFSALVAGGIATSLSNALGNNDQATIAHVKAAGLRIMILSAIIAGIVQIPIIWGVIISYNISEELSSMVWQYAIGCMICTPISIISNVGTQFLQISGKMKLIMTMAIVEGGCNVGFDLLFIAGFHMGVAGAGYGTACSNLIRCAITVFYLLKHTDFFKGDGLRVTFHDVKSILDRGLPVASYALMLAFKNYCILRILLHSFGEDGGVIYGVCAFCLSLVDVLLNGIQNGVRPLMGLYAGADDRLGLRKLMRQGAMLVLAYAGVASIVIILIPGFFYHLNGVDDVPEGGYLSVQLYSLAFVLQGFNYLLRLYFTNRQMIRFGTMLTVLGNATLPLFALLITLTPLPSPFIFLSYTMTELLIFTLGSIRYSRRRAVDKEEDLQGIVFYMTVRPENGPIAARSIEKIAKEHGINRKTAFKTALFLEEMTAYVQEAEGKSLLSGNSKEFLKKMRRTNWFHRLTPEAKEFFENAAWEKVFSRLSSHRRKIRGQIEHAKEIAPQYSIFPRLRKLSDQIQQTDAFASLPPDVKEEITDALKDYESFSFLFTEELTVDITLRFEGIHRAILFTLDDGEFIALDPDEETQKVVTNNYDMIKRMADSVEYQYLLNMNYTKIIIDESEEEKSPD